MTSMRPVPGMYPVSQTFAGTFSTRFSGGASHGAIDFATPTGTPIVAPDDGVIVHSDWAWNLPGGANDWAARWFQLKPSVGNRVGGGGIMTVLRNDAGSHWIFAHLSSNDEAPAGKRVRRGDIIGKTGTTGTSTGPHLHLALIPPRPNWSSGTYGSIDPAPWLTIPFAPNTPTAWQGAATIGKGAAAKTTKKPATKAEKEDPLTMASPQDIEAALARVLKKDGAEMVRAQIEYMLLSPKSTPAKRFRNAIQAISVKSARAELAGLRQDMDRVMLAVAKITQDQSPTPTTTKEPTNG